MVAALERHGRAEVEERIAFHKSLRPIHRSLPARGMCREPPTVSGERLARLIADVGVEDQECRVVGFGTNP